MMNEYAREPAGGTVFTHTWSLGVEEKFYLLWPVLGFVLVRTMRARVVVLAVLFGLVLMAALAGQSYLARAYLGLVMGCSMAGGSGGAACR